MFTKTAKQLVAHMEENQIIKSEDRELYIYGLNQGLSILLNLATALGIGLLFDSFFQLVVFMTAYIPLRSYAGGYHAKTPLRCYIISVVILIIVSISVKYVVLEILTYFIIAFISMTIIAFFSPVGDSNKPLDKIEIMVYKKRARIILLIEMTADALSFFLGWDLLLISISYVLLTISILLLIGKIKHITE